MIEEGVIKFDCHWTRGPPPAADAVAELIVTRQRLYERQLIGHDPDANVGYGNISVRGSEPNQLIISGTQTGYLPELAAEHFTVITDWNLLTNSVSCFGAIEASSETLTHAAIYVLSEAIHAVIHVHHEAAWQSLRGHIPTTADGIAYGTPAMALALDNLYRKSDLPQRKVAVMGGHPGGMISFGVSLAEAEQCLLEVLAPLLKGQ